MIAAVVTRITVIAIITARLRAQFHRSHTAFKNNVSEAVALAMRVIYGPRVGIIGMTTVIKGGYGRQLAVKAMYSPSSRPGMRTRKVLCRN